MIEIFDANLPHGIRLVCRAAGPAHAPVLCCNSRRKVAGCGELMITRRRSAWAR